LLNACREDRDLFTFAALGLNTGMRIGEIVNLTWADVDLPRRVIKVRPKSEGEGVRAWRIKTGEIRDIPVNDFLADVLARHPRHITSPYVLHHADGTPLNTQNIRAGMLKARRWAKLSRTNPHLLRHTFGTTLAAAGVDLDTIRRLMGHTDIKMTMRYLHAAPDRMKGAVDRLPFGRSIAQDLDSRADGKI
jgi:integrase